MLFLSNYGTPQNPINIINMKKLFFLAILFCLQGCVAQNVFEDGDYQPQNEVILRMTVDWIKNDTARIVTEHFKIKYEVDSKDLEPGKQYLFKLLLAHCDHCEVRRAKIIWKAVTPKQAEADMRELTNKS
jgi:hypothetical protein